MARILKHYPHLCLDPEKLNEQLNFHDIFGRSAPMHIEIGSGRGTFLVNQAKANPDLDFLGIEWASKFYRYSLDRIGRWALTNVRIIRTEAAGFIAQHVSDNSVDCFHIYFPDPWPKKRHHKRRFLNSDNLSQMLRCLNKNGTIRFATDHQDYFEQAERVLSTRSDDLERIDFSQAAGAEMGEWVGTNFERKYLKENRPIYTLAVRKL